MNVEIETDESGVCKKFKINGMDLGKAILKAELTIEGGCQPKMLLACNADKILYNGKRVDIFKEQENNKE